MVAVSAGLTFFYIALVVLLNLGWIRSLGDYEQAKHELDRSVDLSGLYTKDQIQRAFETKIVEIPGTDEKNPPLVKEVYSNSDEIPTSTTTSMR
jgi:hypothetical protein